MPFQKETFATAVLLTLGLNAGAVSEATAGDGCTRTKAAVSEEQAPHQVFARHQAVHRDGGAFDRASMMNAGSVQPAGYWSSQDRWLVKTGMAKPVGAESSDIVDVAVAAGSFETLVAALKAAGLVETLKGEGPFTVFAPTDDAFAKIPKADLDALLADKEALTAILTYHVVPGKVMAADVAGLKSATTVQGSRITVDTSDGVKVDGATVIKTDILASNGVIHVIDSVISPK
ncbi:fasciclin domain-containing protein [Thiocystis violacea]|uniref:fasciclin domain-containing protein n=1 Tax=Thiocystis violacea TaxID=13725 RepID=UPI001F5BA12D|nr:fasciclin domain-containing protein [Thiocystis violacea]